MPIASDRRFHMELRALAFAIPPLVVLIISQLVIDLVGLDSIAVLEHLRIEVESATLADPLRAASARLDWSAGLLLFYVIAAAVLVYSILLLQRDLSRSGRIVYVLLACVFISVFLAHALISGESRNAFSLLFYFSRDALSVCRCMSADDLDAVENAVNILNLLAVVVPPIALLAGCVTIVPPLGSNRDQLAGLASNMVRLKIVLAGGSALLVAGLLHQIVWHRWPAALVGAPDDAVVLAFASSLAIYWGVSYSLLAVTFFLPPAALMRRRALAILESDPSACGDCEPPAWLEANGFSGSPAKQLPQITAILAPLLAGSFGSSLPSFAETFALG